MPGVSGSIHPVMDDYVTHRRQRSGPDSRPIPESTSTSGSWMEPVEVWFGLIDRKRSRGVCKSVKHVRNKIQYFIDNWKTQVSIRIDKDTQSGALDSEP